MSLPPRLDSITQRKPFVEGKPPYTEWSFGPGLGCSGTHNRFPVRLRFPANPRANDVAGEPSSTSTFKVCFVFEYLLLLPRSAAPAAPPPINGRASTLNLGYPPYTSTASTRDYESLYRVLLVGSTLGIYRCGLDYVHFQGSPIRPVSCYALLS